MKFKTAIQLYSLRDEMEEDFYKTLSDVKEMGYDGVEFAGLFDKEPSVVRDFLKELGLAPVSAHVSIEDLLTDPDKLISAYATIGCPYLAIPYLVEERRPGQEKFEETIHQIKEIAMALKAAGITLLYHNHDFEFVRVGDEYGLDYLFRSTSQEELGTELDTCWVNVAGEDPAAYLRKYAGRSPLVHLKDFYMKSRDKGGKLYELIGIKDDVETEKDNFHFMPIGYGMQDIPAILRASEDAGSEWIIVEQDSPDPGRTPLEDAKLSIEYLHSIY